MPLLVKTHRRPPDDGAAIYVVRDGRAATVSRWGFQGKRKPLRAFVAGDTSFGTWGSHVAAWQPWARPDTLLLRYENMVEDLPAVLVRLSRFLARPIVRHEVHGRADIAAIDGRWVRERSDWRGKVGHKDMRLFHAMNGEVLTSLGYVPDGADPPLQQDESVRDVGGPWPSRMPWWGSSSGARQDADACVAGSAVAWHGDRWRWPRPGNSCAEFTGVDFRLESPGDLTGMFR